MIISKILNHNTLINPPKLKNNMLILTNKYYKIMIKKRKLSINPLLINIIKIKIK